MNKQEMDDDCWDFLCNNSPKLVVKNISKDFKKATSSLSTNASSDGHNISVNLSTKSPANITTSLRSSITPTKLRLFTPKPPPRDKTPPHPYSRPVLSQKSLTKKVIKPPNLIDTSIRQTNQLSSSREIFSTRSITPVKFRIKSKLQPNGGEDLRSKLGKLGLFSAR